MSDELIAALEKIARPEPAMTTANRTFIEGMATVRRQVELALEAEETRRRQIAPKDEQWITIPRPHVPNGPSGKSAEAADYEYLQSAARNLETSRLFGSNVTTAIVTLIHDAAEAVRKLPPPAPTLAGAVIECDNGEHFVRVMAEGMEKDERGTKETHPWVELNGPMNIYYSYSELVGKGIKKVHFHGSKGI